MGEKVLVLKPLREWSSIVYKQKYLYCLCGWGGEGIGHLEPKPDYPAWTRTDLTKMYSNQSLEKKECAQNDPIHP